MLEDLKSLLKHTSIYSIGEIAKKIVSFLMLPIYTTYLTTEDYGSMEVINLAAMLISMVIAARATAGLVRFYGTAKDERARKRLVSTTFLFVGAVAVAACLLLISQSAWIARVALNLTPERVPEFQVYFNLMFTAMALDLAGNVGFTYLRVLEKSVLYTALSMVQFVLGLGLNIYLIVFLEMGIHGIFISMVVAQAGTTLILVVYTFRKTMFSFDRGDLGRIIKFSAPLVPAALALFVLNMGDRFILIHLSDPEQVGLYSLGYKFAMLLSTLVGWPFIMAWGTKRFALFGRGGDEWKDVNSRVVTYFTFGLVALGLAISVLIREILVVMAHPKFHDAQYVVPLVVLGYIFYNLYLAFDIGIQLAKKTSWIFVINVVAASVNVVANFILIPYFHSGGMGFMGAGISTAISFSICPLLAYLLSQRYHAVNYELARIFKLFAVALVIYGLSFYVTTGHFALDVLLKLVLLALYPVALYLTGTLDDRERLFLKTRWQLFLEKRSKSKQPG